jgi:hypothetical protein
LFCIKSHWYPRLLFFCFIDAIEVSQLWLQEKKIVASQMNLSFFFTDVYVCGCRTATTRIVQQQEQQ